MLGSAKSELSEHRTQLESWRTEVPERARRFHRQAEALSQELDVYLKKWWHWLGNTERQQLANRLERLGNVVDPLRELVGEAERVTKGVERLEERAGHIEPSTSEWLLRCCRQWRVGLEDLGRHTDRPSELAREKMTLHGIRAELEAHETAVGLLHTAREVHRDLEGIDDDELVRRLPEFTGRLEAEGPTEAWLAQFRVFLEPFEKTVETRASPPQALQSVAGMLNELRAWARHLGTLHEVKLLEEKKGFYAVEWTRRDLSELDDLKEEAEELLHRYAESARDLREEKLRKMEEELEDFFAVCGHQPELEERFGRLKQSHRRLDRPQLHPKWLKELDQECSFFKAIVENYQTDLAEWLEKLASKLEHGVRELHEMPLSAEVRQKLRELEFETARLRKMKGVEEILRGLRHGKDFEQDLEALVREARRDVQELEQARQELVVKLGQLEAISPEALGPGDREDLAQVLEVLRDSIERPVTSPRESLALFHDLLEQCRVLFDQVRREEIETRERRESLRGRWQAFKSAHLRRYLPEIGERVEALIHGLPGEVRHLREATAQLQRAEELFTRLDHQTRRLAARDLEESVGRLKELSRRSTDEAAKSRAKELLAAVAQYGHRELPPPTLRMQIRGVLRGVRQGAPR